MFNVSESDTPELDSIRGQVVWFFSELDRQLAGAAKQLDDGLKNQHNKKLLKAANNGLNFDSDAYMDSLSDKE